MPPPPVVVDKPTWPVHSVLEKRLREDGPTMASATGESTFGLDDGLSDAARAAVSGPPSSRRSPLASTQFSSPSSANPSGPDTSFVREEFVRPNPGPPFPHPATAARIDEDPEPTRAVPREEMLRGVEQDAHVIVGNDAAGDDATLAVSPDSIDGVKHRAALADAYRNDRGGDGFPLPPGAGFPPGPNLPMTGAPTPPVGPPYPMGGAPAWNDPQRQAWNEPQQQAWPGHAHNMAPPNPPMPMHPYAPMGYPPGPMPPHVGGQPPNMHAHMAMQGQMPGAYAGQRMPMMPSQQPQLPAGWGVPAPDGKRIRVSGQVLILAAVGFVCLAIFVTGIVLFATTKF